MTSPPPAADDENRFLRGVRVAVRADAAAFGYSILITATFGLVQLEQPPVSAGRVFAFALGATFAFAIVEAASSRLFRVRLREEPSDIVLVGSAMAPIAVSASLGAAFMAVVLVDGASSWFLAPTIATIGYVVVTGAQLTIARSYAERHPPEEESDDEPEDS